MLKKIKCIYCGKLLNKNNCYNFDDDSKRRNRCIECCLKRHKEYYQKKKEEIKQRVQKYYQKNKEKIKKYWYQWFLKNKDKHKIHHKKWYEKKKKTDPQYFIKKTQKYLKQMVKYTRNYRKKHREWYIATKLKRRFRELNGKGLTKEDILYKLKEQNNKCFYCKTDISKNYTVDHKLPLCRGGLNEVENIVMSCIKCNARKGKKTSEEFLEYLKNYNNLSIS